MSVVASLERLGGVASYASLVRLTSKRAVRKAVEVGDVVRDARGRLSLPTADAAVRRAHALGGVVSGPSAAALHGWSLKQQPAVPEVTVPKHRRTSEREAVRFVDLHPDEIVDGVTSRDRTLVDCLRRLPFDEALCIADSALRDGMSPAALAALARGVRGPGAPQVRRVAELARGESANAFESVLRALAIEAGLDVEPQVWIAEDGQRIRPDLVDEGRRLVLEADYVVELLRSFARAERRTEVARRRGKAA